MRFERWHQPLLSTRDFFRRIARYGGVAVAIVGLSLVAGVVGYRVIAGLSWVDAILNASMLMSGMGAVGALESDAAKLFAAAYALYCGLIVLVAFGVLATPVLHRLLHHFHLDAEEQA
jgi:hypothetical protein